MYSLTSNVRLQSTVTAPSSSSSHSNATRLQSKDINKAYEPPVFSHSYPGSRVLEFNRSNTDGNTLTTDLCVSLIEKLDACKDNHAISTVLFRSDSLDVFSLGFDSNKFNNKDDRKQALKAIHNLSDCISKYNKYKPLISSYGGTITGTAFGVFQGSKYLLGGPTLELSINELSKGMFPVGGIAYHLSRGSEGGYAIARYAAVSGIKLSSSDLYSLGTISHLVEEEPSDSLLFALASSTAPFQIDNSKLTEIVDSSSIDDLLDTMHVSEDMDVLDHDLWTKMCIVAPIKLPPDEKTFIEEKSSQILECFSSHDVDKCMTSLQAIDEPWAIEVLEKMKSINRNVLVSWFRLTEEASIPKTTINDIYDMEEDLFNKL